MAGWERGEGPGPHARATGLFPREPRKRTLLQAAKGSKQPEEDFLSRGLLLLLVYRGRDPEGGGLDGGGVGGVRLEWHLHAGEFFAPQQSKEVTSGWKGHLLVRER